MFIYVGLFRDAITLRGWWDTVNKVAGGNQLPSSYWFFYDSRAYIKSAAVSIIFLIRSNYYSHNFFIIKLILVFVCRTTTYTHRSLLYTYERVVFWDQMSICQTDVYTRSSYSYIDTASNIEHMFLLYEFLCFEGCELAVMCASYTKTADGTECACVLHTHTHG